VDVVQGVVGADPEARGPGEAIRRVVMPGVGVLMPPRSPLCDRCVIEGSGPGHKRSTLHDTHIDQLSDKTHLIRESNVQVLRGLDDKAPPSTHSTAQPDPTFKGPGRGADKV